jgi:hypothetical protein
MPEEDDGGGGFLPDKPPGIGDVVGDEIAPGSRRSPVTALVEGDDLPMG